MFGRRICNCLLLLESTANGQKMWRCLPRSKGSQCSFHTTLCTHRNVCYKNICKLCMHLWLHFQTSITRVKCIAEKDCKEWCS
uniref:Putative secreted protein n=1 Tax=Amblyomma parvum TaxID=251391 RepID=A0A023G091_AMBPA